MSEIATYYVTLQPVKDGASKMSGMHHIAYVDEPAVEEVGIFLNVHDARIVADDESKKLILDYLSNCGVVKPDNWVEVSDEDYLSARELNLNEVTDSESYNDFQKKGGGGQWLVRYEYSGPSDDKTRDFCKDILRLGRLYTEEEIKNGLSNPEFGNYSIFDYKGSYGCRHVWKRKIFFEDYEDGEVRRVGFVPQVVMRLDDKEATTLNAFLSKDEKMQVIAPLLIPDKDIFRNDEIGRYNMRFSVDTISDLREVAMSNQIFGRKDLFKDTHKGGIAPSYTIDQWMSASPEDKAYTEFGFDINRNPVGTWFVHSQITDRDYWEKEIKLNKKYAYSIEALINLSIVQLSAEHQQYGDVLVRNNKGEFLILQRSEDDDYMPNKLCLAGGKIEFGENFEQGALRELFEETGIKHDKATFIDTILNDDGSASHYYTLTTDQQFKPSHEHKAFSWVANLDNFNEDMFIENDKQRLVNLINKVKMEKEQILLPDGEHLINGTIYVVKDGAVVDKKEVTPEQEAVVEEVVNEAPEVLEATPEEVVEEVKPEVMEEVAPMAAPVEDERIAKLEADQESILAEIAKLRAELVTPSVDAVPVEMSDNRPMWKRISDGLNKVK